MHLAMFRIGTAWRSQSHAEQQAKAARLYVTRDGRGRVVASR